MNDLASLLASYNKIYRKFKRDPNTGCTIEIFEDGRCQLNACGPGMYDDDGDGYESFESVEDMVSYLDSIACPNDVRIHELYKYQD